MGNKRQGHNEAKQAPIHPEEALVKMREYFASLPELPPSVDGSPIHWMVKDESYGLLLLDSGYLMCKFGFSGIQLRVHSNESSIFTPAELAPHFQRFLDWLALNIPQTKTWAVEFKQGCPLIPCDREAIEG